MDYAVLIEGEDNIRPVNIAVMQELGEEIARSFSYRCLDNNCAVAMRPVFPKKHRKRGKEAHSPHFRAQPKNHIAGCQANNRKEIIEDTQKERGKNRVFDIVERADYPVRFTKSTRKKKPSETGEISAPEILNDAGSNTNSRKSPTRRESKPQSNSIRRFVEAFEKFPNAHRKMEIKLPGCPAGNYADAFFYIGQNEKRQLDRLSNYIFWGKYISHLTHPSGISVLFGTISANNRKIGIWIPAGLKSEPLWRIVFERLERAAVQKNATAYIFGRFVNHRNWKYSIELKDLYDFWITFPREAQTETAYE